MTAPTQEDLLRARETLRKWHSAAKRKGNDEAMEEIENIMRVFKALWVG